MPKTKTSQQGASQEATLDRPKRILHIGKYFPPHRGGMERYLKDLMNAQTDCGIETSAVVHRSRRSMTSKVKVVHRHNTSYKIFQAARLFNISHLPISPLFVATLQAAMKEFKPDILHIHHPNPSALWLLLLPRAYRPEWISHWHCDVLSDDSSNIMKLLYRLFRPFEKKILRKSKLIIVSSQPYLEGSSALQSFREKVKIRPLGIDRSRMSLNAWQNKKNKSTPPLILSVGRLVKYKSQKTLVLAMKYLTDCNCLIIGEGPEQHRLEKLIKNTGLEDRMRVMGSLPDQELWKIYKECDVFVLPSVNKNEAFGMVLLEAAHFGKPSVVCDIAGSGVPWLAGQLVGCRVVPPNDPGAMSAGIKACLENPIESAAITKSLRPFDFGVSNITLANFDD